MVCRRDCGARTADLILALVAVMVSTSTGTTTSAGEVSRMLIDKLLSDHNST